MFFFHSLPELVLPVTWRVSCRLTPVLLERSHDQDSRHTQIDMVLHCRISGPHEVVEDNATCHCDIEFYRLGLLLHSIQEIMETIGQGAEGILYYIPHT